MIKVIVYRSGGLLQGLEVSGHSGFQPRGSDIVCSAISALSQTAIPALEQVADVKPDWSRTDGRLICKLPPDLDHRDLDAAQAVLQTVIIGIETIAKQYPQHVTVNNKEV